MACRSTSTMALMFSVVGSGWPLPSVLLTHGQGLVQGLRPFDSSSRRALENQTVARRLRAPPGSRVAHTRQQAQSGGAGVAGVVTGKAAVHHLSALGMRPDERAVIASQIEEEIGDGGETYPHAGA